MDKGKDSLSADWSDGWSPSMTVAIAIEEAAPAIRTKLCLALFDVEGHSESADIGRLGS